MDYGQRTISRVGAPGTHTPANGGPMTDRSAARAPRKILFASQKGGVGKTASAINVATCLGLGGYRVLLVDTDPIGSVGACFGTTVAPGHPGIYGLEQWDLADLTIPEVALNLDLLPYAEDRRAIDLNSVYRGLDELGRRATGSYDFVIVDSRPSVADMTRRLCQVVDEVVVVVQCQPMAYRTLGGILGQLRDARSDGAPARLLGLLLTMVDPNDAKQAQLEAHIRRSLGQAMMPISIPMDDAVKEGVMTDRPVVIMRPDAPSSIAYQEVAQFVVAAGQPAA